MLTVFWHMTDVAVPVLWEHCNSAAYCVTLTKLLHAISEKRSAANQHIRFIQHTADNVRSHVSCPVREKLKGYGWVVLEHSPYSSYLAPSDYHLFGCMKKFLVGKKFDDELNANVALFAADGDL